MLGTPPTHTTYFIDLPLTRLHVLETGSGEPLIIVPATISELENWLPLAQFMAQWFRVYFFELPGHGQSQPFHHGFSSQKVAELVGQLADTLGHQRFNLMGFSFGGMLAMRTFKLLSSRIDRMILIAPFVGRQALPFSPVRLGLLYAANRLLSHPKIRQKFADLIHNPRTATRTVEVLHKIGCVENTALLENKLSHTQIGTIAVLNSQINEILTAEFRAELHRSETPCYFAMSIYDPLLDFETTQTILQSHFANVSTVRLTYPFHQPPRAFTYDELNSAFYNTVDAFLSPCA